MAEPAAWLVNHVIAKVPVLRIVQRVITRFLLKQLGLKDEREEPMVRSLSWVAATVAVVASCLPAHAKKYPSKAIRVVVPQAAGGCLDVVARLV